jgi:hypothetical protein
VRVCLPMSMPAIHAARNSSSSSHSLTTLFELAHLVQALYGASSSRWALCSRVRAGILPIAGTPVVRLLVAKIAQRVPQHRWPKLSQRVMPQAVQAMQTVLAVQAIQQARHPQHNQGERPQLGASALVNAAKALFTRTSRTVRSLASVESICICS